MNTKLKPNPKTLPFSLEYHRKPTESEIKFGHGAIHYQNFTQRHYLKTDGTIKKRLKCPHTGLIYTR